MSKQMQATVPQQQDEKQPPHKPASEHRKACRRIEAVAAQLHRSLTNQGEAGRGWHALGVMWRSAERSVEHVENWLAWSEGQEDQPSPDLLRLHLQPAAASLLDLASMVESMRRAER
jgi:hypothetical protein